MKLFEKMAIIIIVALVGYMGLVEISGERWNDREQALATEIAKRSADNDVIESKIQSKREDIETKKKEQTKALALEQRAIDTVPADSSWEGITIVKAGKNEYGLSLAYKTFPPQSLVLADTKSLVRAILKQVLAQGRSPADDWTLVTVDAHINSIGETGKKLVRPLGVAFYNFNKDLIEFHQP
ncbi:MAG: hypothetical protein EPN62_08645 [Candidimonas sp.]|nr:MAG: hypothetical protein EPN77_05880 [Candidimonas sp.]TAM23735.1 MAG: hypothetical protein EPN62_08645 [Candidimonas sp.]